MRKTIAASRAPLTLVALGPLTNVALLVRTAPHLWGSAVGFAAGLPPVLRVVQGGADQLVPVPLPGRDMLPGLGMAVQRVVVPAGAACRAARCIESAPMKPTVATVSRSPSRVVERGIASS